MVRTRSLANGALVMVAAFLMRGVSAGLRIKARKIPIEPPAPLLQQMNTALPKNLKKMQLLNPTALLSLFRQTPEGAEITMTPVGGLPPPPSVPRPADALNAAKAAREKAQAALTIVTPDLAVHAANMASQFLTGGKITSKAIAEAIHDVMSDEPHQLRTVFSGPAPAGAAATTTMPTTPSPEEVLSSGPRLGPPEPPKCEASAFRLSSHHVGTQFSPFEPKDAAGEPIPIKDGGRLWELKDGGYASSIQIC